MVDFDKSNEVIKISGKVDKSKTTGLLVIFCSFFTELLQTKHLLSFFYILAIEKIDEIKEKIKV